MREANLWTHIFKLCIWTEIEDCRNTESPSLLDLPYCIFIDCSSSLSLFAAETSCSICRGRGGCQRSTPDSTPPKYAWLSTSYTKEVRQDWLVFSQDYSRTKWLGKTMRLVNANSKSTQDKQPVYNGQANQVDFNKQYSRQFMYK